MSSTNYIDVHSIGTLAEFGIKKIVAAIGVFDGVHLGHQKLLDRLLKMSNRVDAIPVALTFYPHPREVLKPNHSPEQLIPQHAKVKLLHKHGIKAVVTIPFTTDFASMGPEEFIKTVLNSNLVELCGICVGREWRFGAKGAGNTKLLERFSKNGHFEFEAVRELSTSEGKISSTAIRRAISGGSLKQARAMLGRPYSLFATVKAGRQIASSKLNHPTANLQIETGIIPPNGVYAGYLLHNEKRYDAAIAIGVSPTFKHEFKEERRVEVHILDYKQNIYDEQVEVVMIKHIREERFFSNATELKNQIELDITEIRETLSLENK